MDFFTHTKLGKIIQREYHFQQPDIQEGVYIISVAAKILEMHPQTLRKYERFGLISPNRTVGMLRIYYEEDIARLKLIKRLAGELGINLAGIHLILGIFNKLLAMRNSIPELKSQADQEFIAKNLNEILDILQNSR